MGNVYAKKWRDKNPEKVKSYARSFSGRYTQLKRAAKFHGRVLDLSFDEYKKLVSAGICFYCGGPLAEAGYGLDRRDHRKDYTLENCVPCCGTKNGKRTKSCNFRKGLLEGAGFFYPRTITLLMELIGKDSENA